jgi:hypothetical protein
MKRLYGLLLRGRSRETTRPKPLDSEHLHRIYRETHRHVEDLRRAA